LNGAFASLLWNQPAIRIDHRNHDPLFVAGLLIRSWLNAANIVVCGDHEIGRVVDTLSNAR
jgi:hypothetical protein